MELPRPSRFLDLDECPQRNKSLLSAILRRSRTKPNESNAECCDSGVQSEKSNSIASPRPSSTKSSKDKSETCKASSQSKKSASSVIPRRMTSSKDKYESCDTVVQSEKSKSGAIPCHSSTKSSKGTSESDGGLQSLNSKSSALLRQSRDEYESCDAVVQSEKRTSSAIPRPSSKKPSKGRPESCDGGVQSLNSKTSAIPRHSIMKSSKDKSESCDSGVQSLNSKSSAIPRDSSTKSSNCKFEAYDAIVQSEKGTSSAIPRDSSMKSSKDKSESFDGSVQSLNSKSTAIPRDSSMKPSNCKFEAYDAIVQSEKGTSSATPRDSSTKLSKDKSESFDGSVQSEKSTSSLFSQLARKISGKHTAGSQHLLISIPETCDASRYDESSRSRCYEVNTTSGPVLVKVIFQAMEKVEEPRGEHKDLNCEGNETRDENLPLYSYAEENITGKCALNSSEYVKNRQTINETSVESNVDDESSTMNQTASRINDVLSPSAQAQSESFLQGTSNTVALVETPVENNGDMAPNEFSPMAKTTLSLSDYWLPSPKAQLDSCVPGSDNNKSTFKETSFESNESGALQGLSEMTKATSKLDNVSLPSAQAPLELSVPDTNNTLMLDKTSAGQNDESKAKTEFYFVDVLLLSLQARLDWCMQWTNNGSNAMTPSVMLTVNKWYNDFCNPCNVTQKDSKNTDPFEALDDTVSVLRKKSVKSFRGKKFLKARRRRA